MWTVFIFVLTGLLIDIDLLEKDDIGMNTEKVHSDFLTFIRQKTDLAYILVPIDQKVAVRWSILLYSTQDQPVMF